MSEQRTRLLPFRLRRRDPRRGTAHLFRADDTPADAELRELLAAWAAPPPDPASGARLLDAFRAQAARPPRWRRLLSARLSVPVPVAACAVAAFVVSAVALAALASGDTGTPAATAASAAAAVRIVEVPVTQERVVTRYVYVEREPRATPASRVAPARPAPAPVEAETNDTASYITGVDMAEFHPANKMEIRVIKRGRPEEETAKPDAATERKTR
jgi:hypothetical protein